MRLVAVTAVLASCLTAALAQAPPIATPGGPTAVPKAPSGPPVSPKAGAGGPGPVPKSGSGPPGSVPKSGAGGPGAIPKSSSGGAGAGGKGAGAPITTGRAECSNVHFIIGRGSGEPQGTGMLRVLADAIAKEIPGVTSEGIVYPAALNFSNLLNYVSSSGTGAKAGTNQITQYVKACPKSKVVVTGVSQGADVAGSAICGGGQLLGATPAIAPVSSDVGSHVVAIALFGDPRFKKGMPFNRGNSKNQGIIPHSASQNCKGYHSRILSFCDTGDPFCDSGQDMQAHIRVVTKHMEEAKTFILNKIKTLSIPVRAD